MTDTLKNTPEEKNEIYEKAFAYTKASYSYDDPTIKALFEAVKKAFGNDIVGRIERLDRNKAIMIVCGNDSLTKGIVDYIWYTHPPKLVSRGIGYSPRYISLGYRNYSRWTEEQVKKDLFEWRLSLKEVTSFGGHKYQWNYIQFLQNVKGEYQEVLKSLLALTRAPDSFKLGNQRMLIVSVDTLPENLEGRFEVIKLDSETRDTIQNTVEIKYDKDKHILFTDQKHYRLTGDKKTLIETLYMGQKEKHISLLVEKIAANKGKKSYKEGNCRKLITKTNREIEKEFGIKEFIRNVKNKSGFYCLAQRPKEGIFEGNIEVIKR